MKITYDRGIPVKPELSPFGRAVSVRDDTVVKIQEPEASRRERLRTSAGREVGLQSGLFIVPEIVSFDDSRGEIVFQRLPLTGLRQALSDGHRTMELVGRAAGALAAIHRGLRSSHLTGNVYPEMGVSPARHPVPLHGDFGMRNIFYLRASDDIAVIDWANAQWTGVNTDLGAPEIDIAVFLMSFFHRRVFGPWPISRRHEAARHFLATYASASPHGLDIPTLRAVVAATARSFNEQTSRRVGGLRALGYRYGMIDLHFFLRRLAGGAFAGPRERQRG